MRKYLYEKLKILNLKRSSFSSNFLLFFSQRVLLVIKRVKIISLLHKNAQQEMKPLIT